MSVPDWIIGLCLCQTLWNADIRAYVASVIPPPPSNRRRHASDSTCAYCVLWAMHKTKHKSPLSKGSSIFLYVNTFVRCGDQGTDPENCDNSAHKSFANLGRLLSQAYTELLSKFTVRINPTRRILHKCFPNLCAFPDPCKNRARSVSDGK